MNLVKYLDNKQFLKKKIYKSLNLNQNVERIKKYKIIFYSNA